MSRESPREFRALLLDCDGVLVDSSQATARAWRAWAKATSLDADQAIRLAQGRRILDIMHELVEPERAEAEAERFRGIEMSMVGEVKACVGASRLLELLNDSGLWGVVTSADRVLAEARLKSAGLPQPSVLVAADDVSRGKPSPEGYRIAAQRLGVPPGKCLAIDDLPVGTAAARAAGALALLVGSRPSADDRYIVSSLYDLDVAVVEGRVRVSVRA